MHDTASRTAGIGTQEAQAYLAAIVESSDDAIISKNLDGVISSWNLAAEHIFGFKAEEAIGRPITSLIIPPELWEEERQFLAKLRRGEKIVHHQTIRRTKDGRDIYVSLTISPIRNKNGKIIGASKISRDITQQRLMEKEVTAQREWLKVTLDSIGDAVIATDVHGRVTFLNPQAEEITGWQMAEALHQPLEKVFFIINEETRQPIGNPVAKVIRTGKIEGLANHTALIARNGMEYTIEDSAAPIKMPGGELIGAVLVFHNINNRKILEMELKKKNDSLMEKDRRKDEFLAMLAHELRNPLAPISNALHIMESKTINPKVQEEIIHMANRQVSHMVRLLDDLLDVSRITHGKIIMHYEHIELCDVIKTAVDSVGPAINERKQILRTHMPGCPVWLNGDAIRLSQLVGNLLNNASKYTPNGGYITLEAHQEKAWAIIQVKDNGIGISHEKLPYIFDMFMQVENSMERAQGGLGIGLMLVKTIAELHGGSVEVRSEGKDRGSEFIVKLPVAEQADKDDVREADREHKASTSASFRVLVVDDNEASAKTLGWMVEILGHEVQLAYDAESAIRRADEYMPDVVLLDIGMPGTNGYEICKAMHKNPALKNTVFIAQTGWGQEQHLLRSREVGFDYHLIKPVSIEELQRQFEKITSRKSKPSSDVTNPEPADG